MTTFDDREQSFEKRFAHDAEMRFKVEARRNKLLGLWAAGILGLSGEDADAYARKIIAADLEEPGDEDVFRAVRADFDAAGADVSDARLREAMSERLVEAERQLRDETK